MKIKVVSDKIEYSQSIKDDFLVQEVFQPEEFFISGQKTVKKIHLYLKNNLPSITIDKDPIHISVQIHLAATNSSSSIVSLVLPKAKSSMY